MAKGPISNVYITGGSSANGARYPASRWEVLAVIKKIDAFDTNQISSFTRTPLCCHTPPLTWFLSPFDPVRFAVTVALMAPWHPAQMTLTTAGLAWWLQCLAWGTTTTKTSTMRTTRKTNPAHTSALPTSTVPQTTVTVGIQSLSVCASGTLSPLCPCLYFCLAFSGV